MTTKGEFKAIITTDKLKEEELNNVNEWIKECDCGACKPKKCNGCNKIKRGFVNVLDGKFYCVDCINKSWEKNDNSN